MKLYFDEHGIVRIASTTKVITNLYEWIEVDEKKLTGNPVGKRVVFGGREGDSGMRLAIICNWGDRCGIATYSKFLVDALRPLVSDLKVFAETGGQGDEDGVERCWTRGQSAADCVRRVIEWRPSVVLVQHEFGLFPSAPYLFQMLQAFDAHAVPCAVTLHSVYEHLDKVICTSAMKNIVVHTASGRDCLRRLGHQSNIEVIPHGCVRHEGVQENWNITRTPYAIIQFGFGFSYKGVEVALRAVGRLKELFPEKYAGDTPIHYCYLCSESPHLRNVNGDYYRTLTRTTEELGLEDNAMIIRGFQADDIINQYLRTYKLAVFPYVEHPNNVVYGASGAVRIAMANRIPTIVSKSHMFDDMDNVLMRVDGSDDLARNIDKVFSDHKYRDRLVGYADDYIIENTWERTARRYYNFLASLVDIGDADSIVI